MIGNSCGQNYTFRINDKDDLLTIVGEGDLHETDLDSLLAYSTYEQFDEVVRFASGKPPEAEAVDFCRYRFIVFPTQALKDQYVTKDPIIYTVVVVMIFCGTSLVFLIYDWVVRRRQKKVLDRATRTGAIVSSLFPKNVRQRLYETEKRGGENRSLSRLGTPKSHIQSYLSDTTVDLLGSEPLADLFPHTTSKLSRRCFIPPIPNINPQLDSHP